MTEPAQTSAERTGAGTSLWRALAVVYAILLTVATHWPALDIGTEEHPAADKVIHLYAFAILTALLWLTGWFRARSLFLLIMLLWVVADELTQSLPILERQFSMLDVLSSALGVLVAWAWIAALRPLGGPANRARLGVQHQALRALFGGLHSTAQRMAWAILAAAIVSVGLGLLLVLPRVMSTLPDIAPAMGYAIAQSLWIGVLILLFDRLYRGEVAAARAERRCPFCGAAAAAESIDAAGASACRVCGARLHEATWKPALAPDAANMRRLLRGSLAAGAAMLIAGALVFIIAMWVYAWSAGHAQGGRPIFATMRGVMALPDDFVLTVDLALLLLAVAAMAWMCRRNLARWHDRQQAVCRRCGYDLRATPRASGAGQCPECGTEFAVF